MAKKYIGILMVAVGVGMVSGWVVVVRSDGRVASTTTDEVPIVVPVASTTLGDSSVRIIDTDVIPYKKTRDTRHARADVQDSTTQQAGTTAEPVVGTLPQPVPSLERSVKVPATFSPEAARIVQNNIAEVISTLRTDTAHFEAWMELGIQRKLIADYEGTQEAWEYAGRLAPTSALVASNLGNLYHYQLKAFSTAEVHLVRAVALSPTNVLYTMNLHDLYRLSYKQETDQAAKVLIEGLKHIPNHPDLLVALAIWHRERGNTAEAQTAFEQALREAQKRMNQILVTSIKTALALL